jgi:hypothetical protein
LRYLRMGGVHTSKGARFLCLQASHLLDSCIHVGSCGIGGCLGLLELRLQLLRVLQRGVAALKQGFGTRVLLGFES